MNALLAAILAVAPTTGSDDSNPSVFLAPIEWSGIDDAEQRDRLTTAMKGGAEDGQISLVQPGSPTPCDAEQSECNLRQARAVGAKWVVEPKIGGTNNVYSFQLDVLEVASGRTVATSSERCEVCGVAEAADMVSEQVRAIGQRIESLSLSEGVLVVSGTPTGADIFVNGERVGQAPAEIKLSPGEHLVEVRAQGYLPSRRTVRSVRGVSDPWEFALQQQQPDVTLSLRPDRLWPAGIGLIAGGAVLTGVGVTFIVLEERPYRSGCTEDGSGLCQKRWRSLEFGAAMAAVGGAALITGAVLTAIGAKRRKAQRAAIGPSPGGLAVRF